MPSRTPMHHSHHDVLHLIFTQLGASSAFEIVLAEPGRCERSRNQYRAHRGDRWTYVDREVAIRLRANGAAWSGEVLRDPVAVA